MFAQFRPAFVLLAAMTLMTGVAYPLAMTGIGQALFPVQASSSLVLRDGKPAGSTLVGQAFTRPEYVQGRPSAAGDGYDAANSGGSNLGQTSAKQKDAVAARLTRVSPPAGAAVPIDMVTASASGLDPHLSPQAVYLQLDRIALARHVSTADLRRLVDAHVEGRLLGIFGAPRVNVLLLNLALDESFPAGARSR